MLIFNFLETPVPQWKAELRWRRWLKRQVVREGCACSIIGEAVAAPELLTLPEILDLRLGRRSPDWMNRPAAPWPGDRLTTIVWPMTRLTPEDLVAP